MRYTQLNTRWIRRSISFVHVCVCVAQEMISISKNKMVAGEQCKHSHTCIEENHVFKHLCMCVCVCVRMDRGEFRLLPTVIFVLKFNYN